MFVKIICLVCGIRFEVTVLQGLTCPNSGCKNDCMLKFSVAENQTIPTD